MDTENRHYKLTTLIDGPRGRDDAGPIRWLSRGGRITTNGEEGSVKGNRGLKKTGLRGLERSLDVRKVGIAAK